MGIQFTNMSKKNRRAIHSLYLISACYLFVCISYLNFYNPPPIDLTVVNTSTNPREKEEQNHLLKKYTQSTTSVSGDYSVSQQHQQKEEQQHDNRRIVLLAGPHKTSSTSVQSSMDMWIDQHGKKENDNEKVPVGGLRKHWTLPIPEGIRKFCKLPRRKLFAPLAMDLLVMNEEPKRRNQLCNGTDILDMFKDEFHKQWNNGRSLLIGSEEFDRIASADRDVGNQLLENLLHILPVESTATITAVVVYRAPRLEHLISIWHQWQLKKRDETFYSFLLLNGVGYNILPLDSLLLAERFVQRGIDTVLIDLSGVMNNKYDISHVIACDVLGADCDAEKNFVGEEILNPVKANVKHHSKSELNMTDAQLDAINKLIESYDCNFHYLLNNKKLKVLYPYELHRIMSRCSTNNETLSQSNDYPKSQDQMSNKIVEILLSE